MDQSMAPKMGLKRVLPHLVVHGKNMKNEIKGTPLIFLFVMLVDAIVSASIPFFDLRVAIREGYTNLYFYSSFIIGIMVLICALYVIYAFYRRKSNAIFYGWVYMLVTAGSNVLGLIPEESTEWSIGGLLWAVVGIIWAISGMLFLYNSEDLKELLPQSSRHASGIDVLIALLGFIITPFILAVISEASIPIQNAYYTKQEEQKMLSLPLPDRQYTDGRIIFQVPKDFECEQKVDVQHDSTIVYMMRCDSIGCIMYISSDYFEDGNPEELFDHCWESQRRAMRLPLTHQHAERFVNTFKGHPLYCLSTRYWIDNSLVFCRFFMLFDPETTKVAAIISLDGGNSMPIDNLTSSVRFK